MSRFLSAVVVTVVTATSFAAASPEFRVSTPVAAPAFASQDNPSVASNGVDSFAVWTDTRRSTPFVSRLNVYGSRVDAAGHLVNPSGQLITGNVYRALIASNGHGYLLLFNDAQTGADLYSKRISDSGDVQQDRGFVTSGYLEGLASNGSGFCALVSEGNQNYGAVFLNADGTYAGRAELGALSDPAIVAAGPDYRVVDVQPGSAIIRLTSVDSATHAVSTKLLSNVGGNLYRFNAITVAQHIVIAVTSAVLGTNGTASVTVLSTDLAGNITKGPQQIAQETGNVTVAFDRPSLATDGSQVLVAWSDPIAQSGRLVGIRLTADGTEIDAKPFPITDPMASSFVSANSANGVVLLYATKKTAFGPADLLVDHLDSFGQLAVASAASSAVVQTAPGQADAAVAPAGSRAIAVWREFDQPSALRGSVIDPIARAAEVTFTVADRSSASVSAPAVAAIGSIALVAWTDSDGTTTRVLARRVGLDGVLRDAQPIVLDAVTGVPYPDSVATPSIATDGSQFLVVWTGGYQIRATRMLPDGSIRDTTPIVVSRDTSEFVTRAVPKVVWSGTSFVVAWWDFASCGCLVSPPIPPTITLRDGRVSSAGQVLDATISPTLYQYTGYLGALALAQNGSTVMAVWLNANTANGICLEALPLDRDGSARGGSPIEFHCENIDDPAPSFPNDIAIVPHLQSFEVLWSSSDGMHDVRAAVLSTTGVAGDPFVISPSGVEAWGPAVALTSAGTVAIYAHLDDAAQSGDVPRLFGRVLNDGGAPKRRAVR